MNPSGLVPISKVLTSIPLLCPKCGDKQIALQQISFYAGERDVQLNAHRYVETKLPTFLSGQTLYLSCRCSNGDEFCIGYFFCDSGNTQVEISVPDTSDLEGVSG